MAGAFLWCANLNAVEEQISASSEAKLIFEKHRMQESGLDYTSANVADWSAWKRSNPS